MARVLSTKVNLTKVHKALYVVTMHLRRGNDEVILRWLRELKWATEEAIEALVEQGVQVTPRPESERPAPKQGPPAPLPGEYV